MSNITPIINSKIEKVLELEVKSLSDQGVFEGYGSVFGNVDSYGDVVETGAFKNFLDKNKSNAVKMLWQHNTNEPIGVYEHIAENDKGLYVKGRLLIDDIAKAKEAYALLKAGAINGLSIGFTVDNGGYEISKNGTRHLKSLSLWEVSLVTFPANQRAKVANVKAQDTSNKPTIRDFENYLRESGKFSKSEAVRIASNVDAILGHLYIKELQRDAETNEISTKDNEFSHDILQILAALENGVKNL